MRHQTDYWRWWDQEGIEFEGERAAAVSAEVTLEEKVA